MTIAQLKHLLKTTQGNDRIEPGYNYAICSIRHRQSNWVDQFAEVPACIYQNKDEIERRYREASGNTGWQLLPFVVLRRKRSCLVPIPFDTALNVFTKIISDVLIENRLEAQIPSWS